MRALLMAVIAFSAAPAFAHPIGFGVLHLRETEPDRWDVELRVSGAADRAILVDALLPDGCRTLSPPTTEVLPTGVDRRMRIECALEGEVGVRGLSADLQIQLRIDPLDAEPARAILDAQTPTHTLDAPPAGRFAPYVSIGIEHIFAGPDHLLFVFGLVLLLWGRHRALLAAITAFTIGHSLTLSLATFGVLQPGTRAAEIVIAMSIALLGIELVDARKGRTQPGRRAPWLAGGFGLVHGLGFAGALAELQVPREDVPLALLGFNVGVELGQLAFVAAALALGWIGGRVRKPAWKTRALWAATYLIGVAGTYWTISRALG